jgi:hypothetical protein
MHISCASFKPASFIIIILRILQSWCIRMPVILAVGRGCEHKLGGLGMRILELRCRSEQQAPSPLPGWVVAQYKQLKSYTKAVVPVMSSATG